MTKCKCNVNEKQQNIAVPGNGPTYGVTRIDCLFVCWVCFVMEIKAPCGICVFFLKSWTFNSEKEPPSI